MVCCAVTTCNSRSGLHTLKKCGISYHLFPKDEIRREKWAKAIREEWTPSKTSVVCSNHFETSDFFITKLGRRRLYDEAIPSILLSPNEENADGVDKSTENILHDMSSNTTILREALIQSKSEIKQLKRIIRNYKRKVHRLVGLINSLKKKSSDESRQPSFLNGLKSGDLVKRQISKKNNTPLSRIYSSSLREFALTLNYYSPRAYQYVRKYFDLCLPNPRTLRKTTFKNEEK